MTRPLLGPLGTIPRDSEKTGVCVKMVQPCGIRRVFGHHLPFLVGGQPLLGANSLARPTSGVGQSGSIFMQGDTGGYWKEYQDYLPGTPGGGGDP